MTLTVSVLQGGTNSHETTSEEVNFLATDLMSKGVVGVLTNTSGVAPATGGFAVNAQGTPDMTVAVSAGVAYVTATPTSGNSQLLRVKNSASSNVTISANSSGGTRYDWLYVKIDPDKAKDPNSGASDVATLVTSRSTSSATDNGTPPTYGTLIAIITVANAASSIANSNIADRRFGMGASALSNATLSQTATGGNATITAAGVDSAVSMNFVTKGTGVVKANGNPVWAYLGYAQITSNATTTSTSEALVTGLSVTVTVPTGITKVKITVSANSVGNNTSGSYIRVGIWDGTVGSGTELAYMERRAAIASSNDSCTVMAVVAPSAGSKTYNVGMSNDSSSGTATLFASATSPAFILVECC